MSLLRILSTEVTLPQQEITPIKVGKNSISRIVFKSRIITTEIYDSQYSGYYEMYTTLKSPFNIIYLKKWKSRSVAINNKPILRFKENTSIEDLDKETLLKWVENPTMVNELFPEDVINNWAGKFNFKKDDPENNQAGLRLPQLGALHAISAYFASMRNTDPATVVLPTGTGKTETMLATAIYHQCEKILVLVPSNFLREQIANKFLTLGCLSELEVISLLTFMPYVAKLKTGIKDENEMKELVRKSNVIVATPNVLNCCNDDSIRALCEECTYLFIDEAHHVSASTWANVRSQFDGKKIIQFTATPFRNDRESLGGKVIFNYTMDEAQLAGYFRSIKLYSVNEYYDDRADRAIADKAIKVLRNDLEEENDHILMVRVDKKDKANNLLGVYHEIAPDLNPVVVHSNFTRTQNDECLQLLMSRASRVVICVDMLGEGYDLPNLKIAAMHDIHKSLAITLQFIGRFTRTSQSDNIGDASVIVNLADPGISGALEKLYAEGADWDFVLRRLSEDRIDREVALQDLIDSLKEKGDLHNQISLWNIAPSFSTIMFKTDCTGWSPDRYTEVLMKCEEHWHSIAEEPNILIILAVQSSPVKWGRFREVADINYKLMIAHWDNENNALFINSNDYKAFNTEKMARVLCGDSTELMSGTKVFNILNGIEYPLVKNLGSSQVGAISFTQFFGPNVTEGLDQIEKSNSLLSNIAAIGYEDGGKIIWGCSQRKGKVWSPQKRGSIQDWCEWATSAWDKVVNADENESNITKDFLRPEKRTENYPGVAVSAQWGDRVQEIFEDTYLVLFGTVEKHLYEIDLLVKSNEDYSIDIKFKSEDCESTYRFSISKELPAGYSYTLVDGDNLSFKRGNGDTIEFDDEIRRDPIIVYYADGSFSYNCYHVTIPDNIGTYRKEELEEKDWSGTDITNESMGYEQDENSIQFKMFTEIVDEYDIVINDDGCGEAADIVALKQLDDSIVLSLYHCKYSGDSNPGRRLSDLYEVCGQAQRSIRWKHVGIPYLLRHIRNRESLWQGRGYTRFLKGGMVDLVNFKNMSKKLRTEFNVVIIQPGMSKELVTEEMLRLLGTSELFIKKTTLADLRVICSP